MTDLDKWIESSLAERGLNMTVEQKAAYRLAALVGARIMRMKIESEFFSAPNFLFQKNTILELIRGFGEETDIKTDPRKPKGST